MLNGKAQSLLARVLSSANMTWRAQPACLLVAVLSPEPTEPLRLLLEGLVFLGVNTLHHELMRRLLWFLLLALLL